MKKKLLFFSLFLGILFLNLGSEDPERSLHNKSAVVNHSDQRIEDEVSTPLSAVAHSWDDEESSSVVQEEVDEEISKTLKEDKDEVNRFMLLAFHQRAKVLKDELPHYKKKYDFQDRDGATLVHWSVMGSCLECLEVMIERKYPIDRPNHRGETALVFASSSAELEMTKKLLAAGANPNIKFNKVNYSLLMDAAAEGQVEIVEQLIDYGADVNLQDSEGKTALHYAAKEGHTEVVKLLLKYQIDPERIDQKGFSAKDYASKYGFSDITTLL